MTVLIRPAQEGDVDRVVALLHGQMNRKISPERWRRLFSYRWLAGKPDLGRVALDGERVAGFVGMVYADREIGDRRERVVNICAWYLDRDYRGRGLGAELMARATGDPAMSYAILTSSARTRKILDALGYRVLDAERRIWRRGARAAVPALTVVEDPARIAPKVDASSRRLVADHAGLNVKPLLFEASGKTCLVVLSVKLKGDDIAYWDVLHVSDRALFTEHAQDLADTLLPEGGKAVLAADLRFLAGAAAEGERETFAVPRFYKTTRLQRHEIDNLYSEVQLMDLKLD